MKHLLFILLLLGFTADAPRYLSPVAIAVDTTHDCVYTALATDFSVAVTDRKTNRTTTKIHLKQSPNDILLSPDASMLFVACGGAQGKVELYTLPQRKHAGTVAVGHTPQGLACSADGTTLYVANRFSNTVSVVDVRRKAVTATVTVAREPRSLALSPDGKTLSVGNFLPAMAATDTTVACEITLIDIPTNRVRQSVLLPDGSQSVLGLTCSTDGRFLYATHLLSQYRLPVTQLDRGWVNTNAVSIVDLQHDSLYATVLLDDMDKGAANPDGLALKDSRLYIALSGSHELMTLDLPAMHRALSCRNDKSELAYSLSFTAPFKQRLALAGRSPRKVACDGDAVWVCAYFSPFIEKVAIDAPHAVSPAGVKVMLGDEPAMNAVRCGELAFCDASICYQQWQSCVSCHPDGRADGLNWDQQNDGLGNPKNTKSLLYAHVTPPCMITGIRKNAELAVRAGILHTLQSVQPESLAEDMDAYLKQMTPLESPYLAEYQRKDPAGRGKQLFEQAGCAHCHSGPYLTDQKPYDVGTGTDEYRDKPFDTPSLREIWRTAPYLYDGRARTMRDVLTLYNKDDRHGKTSSFSPEELELLELYILSH